METIIDQLDKFREQRHDAAEAKYSEILQRFDNPKPGDAEALDNAMILLKLDRHVLEHDIHVVQRYRAYMRESESAETGEAREQAKKDAQGIRNGSKTLFQAIPEEKK